MSTFSQRFAAMTSLRPWARRTLVGLAVVGLSAGTLGAFAHDGMMGFHGRGGAPMTEAQATQMRDRMVERISGQLKLDATQKQHLVTLFNTLREQRQQMMGAAPAPAAGASAAGPRAELLGLMSGPRFDVQGAQALANRKADAIKTASPKVITAFAGFYDSLKPEQQQQVRDFMSRERGGRRGGHGGHGGHHGGMGGGMGDMMGMGGGMH
jgi:Spy/CpxP family protein refolding chaperone